MRDRSWKFRAEAEIVGRLLGPILDRCHARHGVKRAIAFHGSEPPRVSLQAFIFGQASREKRIGPTVIGPNCTSNVKHRSSPKSTHVTLLNYPTGTAQMLIIFSIPLS